MKIFKLIHEQLLPANGEAVWKFFSDPRNLPAITPPSLNLKILTQELPATIHTGQLIHYSVKTILGIPATWITRISEVREPVLFVDEQQSGPYAYWKHVHRFEAVKKGTLMKDEVDYALPLGLPGRMFHAAIRKKLNYIFEYRSRIISVIFSINQTPEP